MDPHALPTQGDAEIDTQTIPDRKANFKQNASVWQSAHADFQQRCKERKPVDISTFGQ